MSAQEVGGGVFGGGEEGAFGGGGEGNFGGGSMSASASMAPTQFNVSGTTSGSRNSIYGDDREHGM